MAPLKPIPPVSVLLFFLETFVSLIAANSISFDQTVFQPSGTGTLVPRVWEVLGPFPTGMREQDFGADPLEAFGGFPNLPFSDVDRYPSELADNGTVGWFKIETNKDGITVGPIPFEGVRWSFNQLSQGWAINQFQSWARTRLVLPLATTIIIQCTNVGDFYVDSRLFSGDWYNYGTVSHALHLDAGEHEIRVRVVNEIRIFGAKVPPPIAFRCQIEKASEEGRVTVRTPVVPDVVEGVLAGGYASLTVENLKAEVGREGWVEVVELVDEKFYIVPVHRLPIRLTPYQARPIAIKFVHTSPISGSITTRLRIHLRTSHGASMFLWQELTLVYRKWGETFKFTFLDFDGTVHYAMAKPPRTLFRPSAPNVVPPPILIATHGAGVEAEWKSWTDTYDVQEAAWILYPTGRTTWGFDWHGPSYLNVRSALRSLIELPTLFPLVGGVEDGVWIVGEEGRVLYTGTLITFFFYARRHSNGGQGAWYMASHFPDSAVAALPAAGYVKIQDYVLYNLWVGNAHTDPILRGILESAISEYNNDLHVSNMDVMITTDSSPQSSLRSAYRSSLGPAATTTTSRRGTPAIYSPFRPKSPQNSLSEVPDMGHYWNGCLSDDVVTAFLDRFILPDADQRTQEDDRFPHEFTITVANPAGTGSKGGVLIEQLGMPYRLGKVKVTISDNGVWILKTTNIRRFRFVTDVPRIVKRRGEVLKVVVDGTEFVASDVIGRDGWFVWVEEREWKYEPTRFSNPHPLLQFSTSAEWLKHERHPRTYGPAHQIFQSPLPLLIIIPASTADPTYLHVAQKVAHDWYLYGRGDTEIVRDDDLCLRERISDEGFNGNLVLVGGPRMNRMTAEVVVRRGRGEAPSLSAANPTRIPKQVGQYFPSPSPYPSHSPSPTHRIHGSPSNHLMPPGIVFLHPWKSDHLALVIAGVDNDGLHQAVRLLPKRTGVMVPDWSELAVVFGLIGHHRSGNGVEGYWGNPWRRVG
ncbi:hypothetical protein BC938DRAFT_484077 [Jimgerdemannia flammicorona]|uniref:Uncharacterized protein n=1 Tax=Jimgerdemannia flammicorona TaxID=994334 RepID=A0A433QAI2_9FUNG|nr:hypothetical protein BC938DRAFT_484077 [Jimgerdemannia flammicorona]